MKRQSAAEAALKKQITVLNTHLDTLKQAMSELQAKYDNTFEIRDQINQEIFRLAISRGPASNRSRPHD